MCRRQGDVWKGTFNEGKIKAGTVESDDQVIVRYGTLKILQVGSAHE
jgi:hypothetical protein